jgi:internalin A
MNDLNQNESEAVIHSVDGKVNWQEESKRRGEIVRKIVVGGLKGDDDVKPVPGDCLPAEVREKFAKLFPNLTHLYLWGVEGLREVPTLPAGLLCLDVRDCPALTAITRDGEGLPRTIEQLVIHRCSWLRLENDQVHGLAALRELDLRDTPIGDAAVDVLLRGSKVLSSVELSGCDHLTKLTYLPASVVDIRLDRSERLKVLPERWPPRLRRLGLRGAKSIQRVPDVVPSLDYVDLAMTESLQELPKERGQPRTLFLYGSGIRVPPASEHGRGPEENVAARTAGYYRDIGLVGEGEVRRCKVLLLGNGGAGKTTLALALDLRENPLRAKDLGSTHGVRFQDLPAAVEVGGLSQETHIHVWDFGGQEIYHNTHRLFMKKGAIFVIVWDPSQDGKQPERAHCGYQDHWWPLQYWVDFIRLISGRSARIAVVCNLHQCPGTSPDSLRSRFHKELPNADREQIPLFLSDIASRDDGLGDVAKWLHREVAEIVASQGTAVPSYWEVAQAMVERWTRRLEGDAESAASDNQLSPNDFGDRLWEAIGHAVHDDTEGRYWKLSGAIACGDFKLSDDDRVRRTLEFLTNSGWLYWDPRLFEGRIVVGQEWALRGIYAALDRTHESEIYAALSKRQGQFTRSSLAKLCWSRAGQPRYSETEQDLLCSYMVQCGLAFVLRSKEDSWRGEAAYVAFEYLRDAGAEGLRAIFNRRTKGLPNAREVVRNERLHRLHWHSFLIEAGDDYGANADYASDGLHVETMDGGHILYILHVDPERGLSGSVEVLVAGERSPELLKEAVARIKRHLPVEEPVRSDGEARSPWKAKERLSVFVSYAGPWRPIDPVEAPAVPFELPARELVARLRGFQDAGVKIHFAESDLERYAKLHKWMEAASKADVAMIVHSAKYFRSPYCMFELTEIWDGFADDAGRSHERNIIPVEHPTSRVVATGETDACAEFWSSRSKDLAEVFRREAPECLAQVKAAIYAFRGRLSRETFKWNIAWEGDGSAAVAEVRSRIENSLKDLRADSEGTRR